LSGKPDKPGGSISSSPRWKKVGSSSHDKTPA
jgi:hypothetical protein